MIWKKPELPLIMRAPLRHKKIPSSKWTTMRSETIKKSQNYCSYCGGKYDKIMCTVYKYPKTSTACSLCFNIQHLTISNSYQFCILRSKLSQTDIVRKFVNYYEKNNDSPSIKQIDSNATQVPLSLTEYLKSPFKTNLKVFPNQYFSTEYLEKDNAINLIIEEDDDNILSESDKLLEDMNNQDSVNYYIALQKDNPCENIKESELTNKEINYLKQVFTCNNYCLKNKIKKIIKKWSKIDFELQITDMEYELFKKSLVSFSLLNSQ